MTRERTPDSLVNSGEYDSGGRVYEYTDLIVDLNNQFSRALQLSDEHPGFEYLLYGRDLQTNARIATLALTNATYEDVVRYNAPKVEFTVDIDPDDDRLATLLLDLDPTKVGFWITNSLTRNPHIKVNFDNFDRVLDNPIQRKRRRHTQIKPTSYRDLLSSGELIALRGPDDDPISELIT